MIEVSAYKYIDEGILRNPMNGMPLDTYCGKPFEGYCMVYFDDGSQMIFKTGINPEGERTWWAEGNKPKKEFCFV